MWCTTRSFLIRNLSAVPVPINQFCGCCLTSFWFEFEVSFYLTLSHLVYRIDINICCHVTYQANSSRWENHFSFRWNECDTCGLLDKTNVCFVEISQWVVAINFAGIQQHITHYIIISIHSSATLQRQRVYIYFMPLNQKLVQNYTNENFLPKKSFYLRHKHWIFHNIVQHSALEHCLRWNEAHYNFKHIN